VPQHAIAIVGSNHLLGLNKKEFKNYHVLFIRTNDLLHNDELSAAEAFYLSDKVRKVNQGSLKGIETFWYPAKVIKQAEQLHAENKSILCAKTSTPKPSFFKCGKKALPTPPSTFQIRIRS
jgi:hypothetical protein